MFDTSIYSRFLLELFLAQEYLRTGESTSTARKRLGKPLFIIITGIGSQHMEQIMIKEQPLDECVATFLSDLAHANRSQHTRHAYLRDLAHLCAFFHGPLFRAEKNGRGGPLRYQSIQERWYRATARRQVSPARSTSSGIDTRPCALLSSRMERLMQRYGRGDGSIPPPGEEDPTETTSAWPVRSRKNRANVTCTCAEEV